MALALVEGNLYNKDASILNMEINEVNSNPNIAYVADMATINGLMGLDCSACTTQGDNNISVSVNFKIGDIRYIAPNTTVLF